MVGTGHVLTPFHCMDKPGIKCFILYLLGKYSCICLIQLNPHIIKDLPLHVSQCASCIAFTFGEKRLIYIDIEVTKSNIVCSLVNTLALLPVLTDRKYVCSK